MNTVYKSEIFFTVRKNGPTEVLVQEGCVWHWSGIGSNIFTGRYAAYIEGENPGDEPLQTDYLEPTEILDYTSGFPDDDLGTHIFIPSENVNITRDTKIWLLWDYNIETIDWKVTVALSRAIYKDGILVDAYPGDDYPEETDTGFHILMPVEESVLVTDSFRYVASESNPGGILIADVSFDNGEISRVNQIHEGILTLGRKNRIIGDFETTL